MKKALSFVLAAVMVLSLSVSAFAWTDVDAVIAMDPNYTTTEELEVSDVVLSMIENDGEGEKFVIGVSTDTGVASDFNITAKVKKGDDVVKATVKASDKTVEIQAIPDYSWSLTKSEKFEVVVTVRPATKDYKDYEDVEMTVTGVVVLSGTGDLTNANTGAAAIDLSDEGDEDVEYAVTSGDTIKVSDKIDGLVLTFDGLADISMEFGKVYDWSNVNVTFNDKIIKAVQKANLDAELEFYNFVSKPEFDVAGKVIIEAEEDEFVYEVVDGKVVDSKFAWDEDEYAWTLRTNTLGCYVVSDIELATSVVSGSDSSGSTDGGVSNPATGANDMVNVAAALAVVSLAAAGAAAFKRSAR